MLKRYSLIKKIKNDLSLYIATIPNHSKKKTNPDMVKWHFWNYKRSYTDWSNIDGALRR